MIFSIKELLHSLPEAPRGCVDRRRATVLSGQGTRRCAGVTVPITRFRNPILVNNLASSQDAITWVLRQPYPDILRRAGSIRWFPRLGLVA